MQIKPFVFQVEQNSDIDRNTKKNPQEPNHQSGFIWNFVCRAGSQAEISV